MVALAFLLSYAPCCSFLYGTRNSGVLRFLVTPVLCMAQNRFGGFHAGSIECNGHHWCENSFSVQWLMFSPNSTVRQVLFWTGQSVCCIVWQLYKVVVRCSRVVCSSGVCSVWNVEDAVLPFFTLASFNARRFSHIAAWKISGKWPVLLFRPTCVFFFPV